MTKSDLIDKLCESQKLPKGRAELLVNVVFDSMEAALRRGERIEIRGFGSFEIRNYRSYEGRNPRTGVTVKVQPKRLPFFKVGKELKERVNAAGLLAASGENDRPAGRRLARHAPMTGAAPDGDGVPTATAVTETGPVPADSPTARAEAALPTTTRASA